MSQPEIIGDVLARRAADVKQPLVLVGVLGGIGLFIALAGVYGVVATSVSERTREVGVRMAMGASRGAILRLMLWQGARLLFVGVPVGILMGALILSRHGTAIMLGSVSPWDLPTWTGVLLLMGLVGLGASFFPAHRATRIRPFEALRCE